MSCVGSSLCDELISRSEESCRVCVCVCVRLNVCDIESLTIRRPGPDVGCCAIEEEEGVVFE